jgi:preprotein translocase subunit SecE
MIEYFKQVRAELKHVSWPSRRQTAVFTTAVVLLSAATAAYLGLLDYAFSAGIRYLIK